MSLELKRSPDELAEEFARRCLRFDPFARTSVAEVSRVFQRWVRAQHEVGYMPVSCLGRMLSAHGCERIMLRPHHAPPVRAWGGVEVVERGELPPRSLAEGG